MIKTHISTDNGYNYYVELERLHPETKDIELVRLVLHFIAKMMFLIERKYSYVIEELLKFVEEITKTDMNPNDIQQNIPNEIHISEGTVIGKRIEGILYYKDVRTRTIWTKLPKDWFEYQLAHSAMALMKVIINNLDDFHREYLRNSLGYMGEAYLSKQVNPREIKNMISLPNDAFFSRYTNDAST